MENKENRRRKDKYDDADEYRRENRSKRACMRSYSPVKEREHHRDRDRNSRRKRRHSKSRSPEVSNKEGKRRNEAPNGDGAKNSVPERKAKDNDMLNTRTGGAYIPPARLRMMQAQITDKASVAYQRLAWEALKKSIHGHINKINVGNIGIIIKELLKENIVRGRGLLCRSVIQAQAASPTFTNVYAALVAAVNSRFPNIGELLLKRLVIQFKRGFKRNDKAICISSASFIAHLVNQRVAHEILALELLTLLVETPTDDSVEVAIAFLKECGQKLTEVSSKGVNAIFEMLRNILHEGQLDKRVQYMIEVMFQVWKDGFKDHPALIEELELVPEEEQFTHLLMLDDATDPQDILNVFKCDDKYEENEQKYKTLSKDILGSDAESEDEDGSDVSGSEESAEEEEEKKDMTIIDNTETNLVALRRTIYLTINSSLDFEECAHKLMKMQLKPGQEVELCHMFLDCCAEQRTYEKFYGLLAQRFCNINRIYIGPFEEIFKDSYSTAHRLDTNRLRNVSKFFAHLLFTDSISWEVMECVRLNEEDTTSSSRIYIKILFQELAEYMGLKKLNERLKDPTLQEAFSGVFPRDNPKNTRFSINFFTSIGLGGLTDELREHLKQMPKNVPAPITEIKLDSSSDSSSSSSSSSNDSSSSDSSSSESSEEDNGKKARKTKKSKEKNVQKSSDTINEKANENNEKNKEASPERWGHDGFYDTYGQGARRTNSRPKRLEKEAIATERVLRRDYREDNRNGDDNSSRDKRRDNRREDREKDEDKRNRDKNVDSRRNEHEEHRRRDRGYDNDRRRQYNDHRNGDDRRRSDYQAINKNDRNNEKITKRRSSYEERRQNRENDNDRRRHREIEDNNKKVDPKSNLHSDKEKDRDEGYRANKEDSKSKRKEKNKENDIANEPKKDLRSNTETSKKEYISNNDGSKGSVKKTNKQNDDINEDRNRSTRKKESSMNKSDKQKKKKKEPVSSSSSSDSSSSSSGSGSESNSESSSESSSSEEETKRKSKKNVSSKVIKKNDKMHYKVEQKKKNIESKKISDKISNDSDDEEEEKEKKKLGGRYWDQFDISGGAEGKVQEPDKNSKRCER